MSDLYSEYLRVAALVNQGGPCILRVDNPPPTSVAAGPYFIVNVPISSIAEEFSQALLRCANEIIRLKTSDRRLSGVRERRWTGGWQKENKVAYGFIDTRTGPLDRRERK